MKLTKLLLLLSVVFAQSKKTTSKKTTTKPTTTPEPGPVVEVTPTETAP